MMIAVYNNSPYDAINDAYNDKNLKPLGFTRVKRSYWDKDTAVEATKWLIDSLDIPFEDIPQKVTIKTFKDNGLRSIIEKRYNSNVFRAIEEAFPGSFKAWEYKCVPKNYWGDELNCVKAICWLIEEKLNLNKITCSLVRAKDFKKYALHIL